MKLVSRGVQRNTFFLRAPCKVAGRHKNCYLTNIFRKGQGKGFCCCAHALHLKRQCFNLPKTLYQSPCSPVCSSRRKNEKVARIPRASLFFIYFRGRVGSVTPALSYLAHFPSAGVQVFTTIIRHASS